MINIANVINFEKLDNAISEKRNTTIKYLIMNSETLNAMIKEKEESAIYLVNITDYETVTYKGYKIAICEYLNFGEVDIV